MLYKSCYDILGTKPLLCEIRKSNFDYKKVDYAGLFINTNIKEQLTYFKDKNISYKGKFRDTLKYSFCVGGGYFVSKKVAEMVVNNYKKVMNTTDMKNVAWPPVKIEWWDNS